MYNIQLTVLHPLNKGGISTTQNLEKWFKILTISDSTLVAPAHHYMVTPPWPLSWLSFRFHLTEILHVGLSHFKSKPSRKETKEHCFFEINYTSYNIITLFPHLNEGPCFPDLLTKLQHIWGHKTVHYVNVPITTVPKLYSGRICLGYHGSKLVIGQC